MMDANRKERIWREIKEQIEKEVAPKKPGEMTISDLVTQMHNEYGITLTKEAARGRLERMVAQGLMTRRRAHVKEHGAYCIIYTPVDDEEAAE